MPLHMKNGLTIVKKLDSFTDLARKNNFASSFVQEEMFDVVKNKLASFLIITLNNVQLYFYAEFIKSLTFTETQFQFYRNKL